MIETPSNHILFELRHVSKSFGQLKVLEDFNMAITAGQTTVIIGPSGCGKTVLLKHLIMLLRPDSGQIFFDGERIDKLKERQLIDVRKRCGFLFQAGALFDSQTVSQNVAFSLYQHSDMNPEQIRQKVRQQLEMVGMSGMEDRFPSELSGGQQKRVALARAIALGPEAILYDEPTTGLDPIRAATINELIIKLQKQLKVTSIVVTHDMKSAYKIADRIVMLSHGRIIADGTAQEISSHPSDEVQDFIRGDGLVMNNE